MTRPPVSLLAPSGRIRSTAVDTAAHRSRLPRETNSLRPQALASCRPRCTSAYHSAPLAATSVHRLLLQALSAAAQPPPPQHRARPRSLARLPDFADSSRAPRWLSFLLPSVPASATLQLMVRRSLRLPLLQIHASFAPFQLNESFCLDRCRHGSDLIRSGRR